MIQGAAYTAVYRETPGNSGVDASATRPACRVDTLQAEHAPNLNLDVLNGKLLAPVWRRMHHGIQRAERQDDTGKGFNSVSVMQKEAMAITAETAQQALSCDAKG